MKFNEKRKAKMRKQREKNIHKFWTKSSVGMHVDFRLDHVIIDRIVIKKQIYLLVQNGSKNFMIYHAYSKAECIRLSPKALLDLRYYFENSSLWDEHTKITISDDGRKVRTKNNKG